MMGGMVFWGFLVFVLVLSFSDSHRNLSRYHLYGERGTWREHLSEARKASEGVYLDKGVMEDLREDADRYGSVNGENIMELVTANYGKPLEELSADEMEQFFQTRAAAIHENLVSD